MLRRCKANAVEFHGSVMYNETTDYLLNDDYQSDNDLPKVKEVQNDNLGQIMIYLVTLEVMVLLMQFMTTVILQNVFFGFLSFIPFVAAIGGFEYAYQKKASSATEKTKNFRRKFYKKSLRSEKKGPSIFNVKKQMELSQRITELTEDLEELRSERTMLLNQLDCADDKEVKKVKTSVSTMKDTLKNLEAKEVQFSAELDAAQKEFASLQEQAADFDPIDLYNARQAIRPEMEQDAVHKLQERYTDEYSYTTMVDGRREVSLMLDEYAEGQKIQQLKQEQQRKFQQERRQNHLLKKH